MQSIEKALHQPMPFTQGGQTITDRLTAAKHSLAGSQLGKTICKATTEELMAPKKKHLDYLLHCTHEPNVSIPQLANLLIERTQNPSWAVVYKSLITIHNIMCYGNERFSQYLASCNTSFTLSSFLDKGTVQGYDMSTHVRHYGKYISEKVYTYRLVAFDFCKVKRGREDGLLRTMHADKLLKTIPILQNQIDALLEFQVQPAELNNGVINCSFILLFRDLIRLFACYNDGVINLLEKFFDMNKKQCKEALDMYKGFLVRLEKVAEFLKVAESVGIDRGEIPDLARAPASLLEALEAHVVALEGGRPTPQSQLRSVSPSAIHQLSAMTDKAMVDANCLDDSAKQKYLEEERQRLYMYEEQRNRQANLNGDSVGVGSMAPQNGTGLNPFGIPIDQRQMGKPSDDLLNLFDAGPPQQLQSQGPVVENTNPFATALYPSTTTQQQQQQQMAYQTPPPAAPNLQGNVPFGADFTKAFGNTYSTDQPGAGGADYCQRPASSAGKFGGGDLDSALSSLASNLTVDTSKQSAAGKPVQWGGPSRPAMVTAVPQYGHPMNMPMWTGTPPVQPAPGMYGQQPMMQIYHQQPGAMAVMQQPPQQQQQQYAMQQHMAPPAQPGQGPFG